MIKRLKRHGRRIGVISLNLLFGRTWFYRLIGSINNHLLNRPIKSVFLLYPASSKYTLEYVYLWFAKRKKWSPIFCGFFNQSGKWGLTFGISATEDDFFNLKNQDNLKTLVQKIENIRKLVGADQKTFAGVLPGLFHSRGLINREESIERKTTVQAVRLAIDKIKEKIGLPEDVPVMTLGGSGFIGSGLKELTNSGNFHFLDLNNKQSFLDFKKQFNPHPVIILNLTKKGALSEYIPHFWPGVVLVNEVYPEPSKSEVADIRAKGAYCYHIAGVKAKAWPAFPRGYQGGIPCCASFLSDKEEESSFQVILREIK